MMDTLANIALCILAVEMVIYMLTYTGGSPWWSTPLGRIYAIKTVMLTLVLMQNAAGVLSEQAYPGRDLVRFGIYWGSVFAMAGLWWMLRRYQRQGKAARAAEGDFRPWRRVWGDTLRDWAGRK